MREIFVLVMASLPSDRPSVRPTLHVNQCEKRHSNPALQPAFYFGGKFHSPLLLEKQTEILRKAIKLSYVSVKHVDKPGKKRERTNENAGDE